MSLFPEEDNVINKNINPLTNVNWSKSIPAKAAKTFGVSVESIFEGDLVKHQWPRIDERKGNMLIISKPSVDWQAYDFLVDNRLLGIPNPKIFKVQVKSTKNDNSINVAKSTGNKYYNSWDRYSSPYTKDEVDIFACYLKHSDEWWLIPQNLVGDKTSINFNKTTFAGCKNNFEIFME